MKRKESSSQSNSSPATPTSLSRMKTIDQFFKKQPSTSSKSQNGTAGKLFTAVEIRDTEKDVDEAAGSENIEVKHENGVELDESPPCPPAKMVKFVKTKSDLSKVSEKCEQSNDDDDEFTTPKSAKPSSRKRIVIDSDSGLIFHENFLFTIKVLSMQSVFCLDSEVDASLSSTTPNRRIGTRRTEQVSKFEKDDLGAIKNKIKQEITKNESDEDLEDLGEIKRKFKNIAASTPKTSAIGSKSMFSPSTPVTSTPKSALRTPKTPKASTPANVSEHTKCLLSSFAHDDVIAY